MPDLLTADRCDFLDDHECLFPWPNDYFTVADANTDTGRRVNLNILSMPRNVLGKPIDPTEWNRNDGFSPGQDILTRVPGLDLKQTGAVPITRIADSYRADQPIVVIDADTGERQLIWSEMDANLTKFTTCDPLKIIGVVTGFAGDAGLPLDQLAGLIDPLHGACAAAGSIPLSLADPGPALIIRPAVNFTEGHRYIVALRNLKDGSGQIIPAPASFQIYRDNHVSALPVVNDRRAHMEDLFARLAHAGIERKSLYLAWDFTVASTRNNSGRLRHIISDAFSSLGNDKSPPFIVKNPDLGCQLPLPVSLPSSIPSPIPLDCSNANGVQDFTTSQNPEVAREVRGSITVPSYLTLPGGRAGSRFFYAADAQGLYGDGLPDRNPLTPTQTFTYTCRIPRSAFNNADDPATATSVNPARPSLYGHGLLGSQAEVGAGNVSDMGQENNLVFCATDWIGMASGRSSEDPTFGDVPNVLTILLDVSNFPTLADRVQQGVLNFDYLGRAMIAADGFCTNPAFQDSKGHCVIDRSQLYYDGNSQGGIIGGVVIATSPDIHSGVLGVPGMNYSTLLQRSVDFDTYASVLYAAYESSLDQQLVLSLMQMLWDRSENDGYAAHLRAGNNYPGLPAKRVLLTPAFGDHQVSMWTAEVMARTIGADVHCPAVVAGTDVQLGPAVQATGANPAVEAEARVHPDVGRHRRHPDDEPYYGLACIPTDSPYTGNALAVWDSGPTVKADGSPSVNGVAPPPIDNRPPRPELGYGADPHEFPRSTLEDREMKSSFLRPDGFFNDTCGGKPCVTRGFVPAP
ncbi:MAG TPA: hypothetical protein VN046_12120 [Stenotrophobium sp.]|nr:hypothetical protein [Stenotrophobium sp.]